MGVLALCGHQLIAHCCASCQIVAEDAVLANELIRLVKFMLLELEVSVFEVALFVEECQEKEDK